MAFSIAQSLSVLREDESDASSSSTLRRGLYRVARLVAMDTSESDTVRSAAFSALATLTRRPVCLVGGIQRIDVQRAMTVCEFIVLRSSDLLQNSSPMLVSSVAAALDSAMTIVRFESLRCGVLEIEKFPLSLSLSYPLATPHHHRFPKMHYV